MSTPTREDREAAVSAVHETQERLIDRILSGKLDYTDAVQAFMRHRLAAEERGARMALEAAAKVADGWREVDWPEGVSRYAVGHVCEDMADRIRQIDPASLGAE